MEPGWFICSFLDDLVPWQDVVEVLWMPLDVGVRQVLEEVLEVLERVQAVGLGGLDDAVDGGAGFCSLWQTRHWKDSR